MRFGITPEDAEVAASVARFAKEVLARRAQELDEHTRSASVHIPQLAALGLMGMNLPERWGGAGITPVALLLSLVEIARACAATSSLMGAHYLATDSILIGGDDALRERYLPGAGGGHLLGAFGLTEPGAGSNPAEMSTRAQRAGDVYHLTGTKHFISNADEADFIVVYAKTDPEAGHHGISAFVVDRGTPGLQVAPAEKLMGLHGSAVHEVHLDCDVPAAQRLGAEGTGFVTAMKVLDNGRLDVAATCLGIAEAALSEAVAWAQQRVVGGKPLSHRQGIQWKLADMKVRLDAAWALALQAACKRVAGEDFAAESSTAKLYASEAVAYITDEALQIHGGYGYTRDLPLERHVRDARILRIYEGSSEIQRVIIARQLFRS